MWKPIILALALIIPGEALANGTVKRMPSQSSTIQVYEPRQPLVALSVLGHNLIIWEDLRVELFDEEDRRRRRRR